MFAANEKIFHQQLLNTIQPTILWASYDIFNKIRVIILKRVRYSQ